LSNLKTESSWFRDGVHVEVFYLFEVCPQEFCTYGTNLDILTQSECSHYIEARLTIACCCLLKVELYLMIRRKASVKDFKDL